MNESCDAAMDAYYPPLHCTGATKRGLFARRKKADAAFIRKGNPSGIS